LRQAAVRSRTHLCFGAVALALAFAAVLFASDEGDALSAGRKAYVGVAVATLWTEPGMNRAVDAPAVSNPVDINRWVRTMTRAERDGLIGRTQTQALYGQRVTVLAERGSWAKVAVEGQPTPKNSAGYPGWVPKRQLVTGDARYARLYGGRFAQVDERLALLYDDRALKTVRHSLSYGTRLPVVGTTDTRVRVAVPGAPDRWLRRSDVGLYRSYAAIPDPKRRQLVSAARRFAGLTYLWAGTSGYAFDCSGLTHLVYRAHGVTMPRDAADQAKKGRSVPFSRLRPGDLLFFGRGGISHVGMYVGDGDMIHSANSGPGTLRIEGIRASGIFDEYAGARRYLP
jgi:gamma-D-glutamyl-L-lysine dipeptidyl-peptidase